MKEENKVGGSTLPNLKTHYTYYKATIINTGWYWWKKTQSNQWNKIKSPEIDLHKYSQLIFDEGTKAMQWSKGTLQTHSNKWCWNRHPHTHTNKSRHKHYKSRHKN